MLSEKLFLSSVAFFVLVSLLFISSVGASSEMWSQTYGGPEDEIAYCVIETTDGGYAIVGGNLLVKTDVYGTIEWNQTYSGVARSLVETSDGGYVIAGATNIRINYSDADFWLIKTDAYGNMLWNKTYSKDVDYAYSVVETSDGGYAIAGSTGFWYPHACWLVKTDENGLMKWNKIYGGLNDGYYEAAQSVLETSDGGFALAGQTEHGSDGGYDVWIIKTDTQGNIEWNQTYGGTGNDIAYSLIETSDGGYATAGETNSFGAGNSDFWLVKTDGYGIIPEFSSWTVLPLVLAATLTCLIYRKKLHRTGT